jgi:hypothetical protein
VVAGSAMFGDLGFAQVAPPGEDGAGFIADDVPLRRHGTLAAAERCHDAREEPSHGMSLA